VLERDIERDESELDDTEFEIEQPARKRPKSPKNTNQEHTDFTCNFTLTSLLASLNGSMPETTSEKQVLLIP